VHRAPPDRWGAVDRALRDAALGRGYPWKADLNAPDGEGVSCNPINSRDGMRVTTNDGYLEPARGRPNLEIRGGALVDRVLFEGTRAIGVRVRLGGEWQDILAREVVLSAGAIHSPAILLRSGIGPAAQLRGLGIPVLNDLPSVGRNLMDHPIMRATLYLKPQHRARGADARHTNCCVTYSSHLGGGGERDMILIAFNHRLLVGPEPGPQGAVGASVYDAFSRGELHLASAGPEIDPVVEENMLADPRDRLRMRDAIRRLAELTAHPALAGICDSIRLGDTDLTLPDAVALPEAELDAIMLQEAGDIQHAAGTCHMSAHEDPRGVVDPELKVRGVQGLRVCDASIMPTDCRANLHFTCVMIGENLAQRLR
jgi:5-(hydroxymethyl)furfural/furfural oxidase